MNTQDEKLLMDIESQITKIGDNLVRMAKARERRATAEANLLELLSRIFGPPIRQVEKLDLLDSQNPHLDSRMNP
ncbi:MAG: hypothetical protein ACOZF0_04805 [Thermodesulfobacteriota bacterium]